MIDKNLIKLIIAENQGNMLNIAVSKRDYTFEDGLNYVLVGLRRAGKSYLLYQRMQELAREGHSAEEFLYINFEDERLIEFQTSDLNTIITAYGEMYRHTPYIFLDEIQNVEGWEKFARRLADQKYRVYITGSNAKMLSQEIATTLGGRYITKEVFPYTFRERLSSKGIDVADPNCEFKERNSIDKGIEEYFRFGGLPELEGITDKRSWLNSLYGKIFFGDLVARYSIRNDKALRLMVKKLAESIKQPVSFNRLANMISSVGTKISTDSIIDYLGYMQESWLLLPVENYAAKFVEKSSNKKYYFIDNGILNLFLTDSNTSLLENIVAVNLIRRYGEEVYFYNSGVEVDFYLPESKKAIQVSYSLSDQETKKREVRALEKLSAVEDIEKLQIVTMYEEGVIKTQKEKEISVVPLWKWLFDIEHNRD